MSASPIDPRRAYAAVVAATLTYTFLMFVWFSLPAYLPTIIEEAGLSGTQAGILAGAVPLTYIPLALFSGLFVDRVGPVRSIAAGAAIYGAAQVGRSVAPGFGSLLAFTLLIGVGATAITFGLPKLVGTLFPPDRTGVPSSIYLVGAAGGTAAVFAVGRPLLGPALGGWRGLFLWSGIVSVGYAAVWYGGATLGGVDRRGQDDDSGFDLHSVGRDLRVVLSHRELRLVVVVGTMYLLVVHGVQGWLPTILESRGFAPGLAGRTTSLFVAATVVGIVVVPAIADRLSARRGAIMACGAVGAVGLLALLAGGSLAVLGVGVLVGGAGAGGLSPLIRAIPPDLDGVGARLTGTAVGFVFAVGEIGGFLGPVIVGGLYDWTGSFAPGLAVLAAGLLAAVVAGAAMREV